MTDHTDLVHPEAGAPPFRFGPWTWREPAHGEHFRRCSYCGSIHPDDLAAEPTWLPKWADRKYGWPHKFYVDIPNREPDRLVATGSTSRFAEGDRARGYVPVEELTNEQLAIMERDGWRCGPGEGVYFGTRPYHFGKFYAIHLADMRVSPEVKRTIERRSGLHFEFRDGAGLLDWGRAVIRRAAPDGDSTSARLATCTADRHGPGAYGRHGCRCPDVVEHVRAVRTRATRQWRRHRDVDPIAVELACAGEPVVLGITERREAVARLDRYGLSAAQIARRLRISSRTVKRCRIANRQTQTRKEAA